MKDPLWVTSGVIGLMGIDTNGYVLAQHTWAYNGESGTKYVFDTKVIRGQIMAALGVHNDRYAAIRFFDYWPHSISNLEREDADVKVYPNPFRSTLHIEMEDDLGPYRIRVLDMSGGLVWEGYHMENSVEINIEMVPKGIYILYIDWETSNKKYSQKIIYEP